MGKKKRIEQFKKDVYDKVEDEYEVLNEEYINNKTPIKMRHNKCGHIFGKTKQFF